MCPRGEPDIMTRPLGSIFDELFKKITDEVDYFSEPCCFHWFGEPLMHLRLFDQIDYAKQHGVPNLGISTNAALLNRQRAEAILASPLDTRIISIDGACKDVYEKIRISAAFTYEQVCANVREFLALRAEKRRSTPHTTLSIIVMEENTSQLKAFKREWSGLARISHTATSCGDPLRERIGCSRSALVDVCPIRLPRTELRAPSTQSFHPLGPLATASV